MSAGGEIESMGEPAVAVANGKPVDHTELARIRAWDRKCGDNEGTMFGTTIDRRRLLEHVDELRDLLTRGMVEHEEGLRDPWDYWASVAEVLRR